MKLRTLRLVIDRQTPTNANVSTSIQAGIINLNMTNASTYCVDGCGVNMAGWLTDSRYTTVAGKFSFTKINDSLNTTKVQFFVRSGTSDTGANSLAFEATPTGFTVPNLAGSGNAYVCAYANGTLYRGSPIC